MSPACRPRVYLLRVQMDRSSAEISAWRSLAGWDRWNRHAIFILLWRFQVIIQNTKKAGVERTPVVTVTRILTGHVTGRYPLYRNSQSIKQRTNWRSPSLQRICLLLPLYLRSKIVALDPQICGITLDPSADSALWNLENIKSGEACPK